MFCFFFADCVFQLLLQHTECQGRLCCCSRFGYVNQTELFTFQYFTQLIQIIFTDILSGIENNRVLTVRLQPVETVVQCFDNGFCAEIASADTDGNDNFTFRTKHVGRVLDVC